MRYLKKYKTFENSQFDDISDILLELEDIGFSIQKNSYDCKKITNKLCNDVIEITISKNKHYMRYGGRTSGFKYSEIEDTVDRLVDYMTESGWLFDITAGRSVKGGYRIIDFNNVKPKASIIFCRLHLYKTIDHYIKESNNYSDVLFPNQDLIEEYFYDYTDNNTKSEECTLHYSGWLIFLTEYLNSNLESDLKWVMNNQIDWQDNNRDLSLPVKAKDKSKSWGSIFCDLNDTKWDSYPNKFFKTETIMTTLQELNNNGEPTNKYHDNKLSEFQQNILENIKKDIIPAYPIFKVYFGYLKPQNFNTLLDCLMRFYESTGWRPVAEIWTEDYMDGDDISTSYGASIIFCKSSNKEYKKITEIFAVGKPTDHPQLKMNSLFI